MYYITFCVIAILIISGLVGLKRGLFKTLFGFLALILSIVVTYFAGPIVTSYIYDYTIIDEKIEERVYEELKEELEAKVTESLQDAGETKNLETRAKEEAEKILSEEVDRSSQVQLIDDFDFPDSLKTLFIENNNDEMYEKLGIDNFYKYISQYTTYLIVKAMAFFGTFIVLRLLFLLIALIVGWIMREVPILSGLNRIGGLILGLGIGLGVIWVFMIIAGIAFGSAYDEMIEGNTVLEFLNNNNLITTILTQH